MNSRCPIESSGRYHYRVAGTRRRTETVDEFQAGPDCADWRDVPQAASPPALTFFRTVCMVFHMKTTLVIPDPVFRDLKKRAAERDTTMSELVTEYLREGLRQRPRPKKRVSLPSFSMGPPLIDITSRDEIYRVLDLDRLRLYRGIKKG